MGCFSDSLTEEQRNEKHDFLMRCFNCGVYSNLKQMKDEDFKNRLYNENVKIAPLLKAKIDELIEKRNN